nr:MAG TPA: hypothetical protein [Caudoviricetes sp.]
MLVYIQIHYTSFTSFTVLILLHKKLFGWGIWG